MPVSEVLSIAPYWWGPLHSYIPKLDGVPHVNPAVVSVAMCSKPQADGRTVEFSQIISPHVPDNTAR